MQASPEDQSLNAVSNFGFMLCTLTALFFLVGSSKDEDETTSDTSDNEEEIILENYLNDPRTNANLEVYTMMLKDMTQAPDIRVERMPTFNEMLNPRRRSYSADDMDALVLITDRRLQSVYDRALSEVSLTSRATDEYVIDSDGRSSRTSNFSADSWDRLS